MLKYVKLAGILVGGLGLVGLLGFIGIQFVPIDRSNPPTAREPQWDSPQTEALVERACYDCHSNQTQWPWYSSVAPVSWLVAHDVHEGRAALNFTDWEPAKGEGDEDSEIEEIIEEVEKRAMPPRNYVILHPEARLNDIEIKALIDGLKTTLGPGAEGAMAK
jgi:hypothetical protein